MHLPLPSLQAAAASDLGSSLTGGWRRFTIHLGLAAATLFGAIGLAQPLLSLWDLWTDDPLRSIGMLIVGASIVLTLRVWRRLEWELQGTWWGLLPVSLAYLMCALQQRVAWTLVAGPVHFNLLAPKLVLYSFASGVVLLFGGVRLWRRAWFPIGLLLLAQPVPALSTRFVDLPLQSLSAHIARSFAAFIGFPPTNHELLRLMFTPTFGMFIAPGCDGLRGAVTLGYAAMIVGYLKRAPFLRWLFYVCGGVLLGYLLNLLRLCSLVIYYRIAVGHPILEHFARQADYIIGACLMLLTTLLFLRIWTGKATDQRPDHQPRPLPATTRFPSERSSYARAAGLTLLAILPAYPGAMALRHHRRSFAASVHDGKFTPAQLDNLMPKKVGDFAINRAWQEEANGRVAIESAAYVSSAASEVILGVWLPQSGHNMHESWRARGEDPQNREETVFETANHQAVPFDTAFYSDGVVDSFAGNALCTPASCVHSQDIGGNGLAFTLAPIDFKTRGSRAVSVFFRVEIPHTNNPPAALREALSKEAQRFVGAVDFSELSRKFQ